MVEKVFSRSSQSVASFSFPYYISERFVAAEEKSFRRHRCLDTREDGTPCTRPYHDSIPNGKFYRHVSFRKTAIGVSYYKQSISGGIQRDKPVTDQGANSRLCQDELEDKIFTDQVRTATFSND